MQWFSMTWQIIYNSHKINVNKKKRESIRFIRHQAVLAHASGHPLFKSNSSGLGSGRARRLGFLLLLVYRRQNHWRFQHPLGHSNVHIRQQQHAALARCQKKSARGRFMHAGWNVRICTVRGRLCGCYWTILLKLLAEQFSSIIRWCSSEGEQRRNSSINTRVRKWILVKPEVERGKNFHSR